MGFGGLGVLHDPRSVLHESRERSGQADLRKPAKLRRAHGAKGRLFGALGQQSVPQLRYSFSVSSLLAWLYSSGAKAIFLLETRPAAGEEAELSLRGPRQRSAPPWWAILGRDPLEAGRQAWLVGLTALHRDEKVGFGCG